MPISHQALLAPSKSSGAGLKPLCIAFTLLTTFLVVGFATPSNLINSAHSRSSILSELCTRAHDPNSCLTLVSELLPTRGEIPQSDGFFLLQKFLISYVHKMDSAVILATKFRNQINDQFEQRALVDCTELLDLSIDRAADSIMALANKTSLSHANVHTWLSGVLTNHITCLDELNLLRKTSFGTVLEDLISSARASLAMFVSLTSPKEEILETLVGKFPSWIRLSDRKLLESSAKDIQADAVVAADGSGDYRTVGEAVAAAPERSKNRYVIYVKRGTYEENVEVTKRKRNLMIVGDGMDLTIITGSLNVVDGSSTFRSATLAAVGDGFILQDICIQNTAGPEKHQAVALRVGADQSIINRCKIDAFQDTLYTHSQRQFYRDSTVIGTIDFIFGNAAVVFQNCKLIARLPMSNQKNMVTAQGRTDPNQNTGTSIQYCEIIPSSDLEPVKSSIQTYLGRPWKEFSRTMVMQSYIDDHVDPAGWSEWSGDFAKDTLYYGEYMNQGPGAGTSKRVDWPGYHVITDVAEARKFTVAELIQGGQWLDSSIVAFVEGL